MKKSEKGGGVDRRQQAECRKGQVFSIIAHDLRSSFNGFMGLIQFMVEELSSLTMREMQHLAKQMRDSAANLFQLLEDVLQWAIMHQCLIHFNHKVISLLSVADKCIGMLRECAYSRRIDQICDILEMRDRLFVPFATFGKTGLNQAIAKRFVEDHSGRISMTSSPETGTEVTITIPIGKLPE